MKKVSFIARNFEKERYLTYEIGSEAVFDEDVLDFLEEEEPKGLVPIIYEENEEKETFSYDVTDKIRLCELSGQEINAEMVLKVMRGIVLSLIDMGEYRVSLSYLVMNRNYIYINSEYEVEFICVPLEDMADEVDVNSFLRSFMANLRFESSENGDYVAKLLSYINNSAIFNLRNLLTLIEDLMSDYGIELPEDSSADIYVDYQEIFDDDDEDDEEFITAMEQAPVAKEEEVVEESAEEEAEEAAEEPVEEEIEEVTEEPVEEEAEETAEEPVEEEAEEATEELVEEETEEAAEETVEEEAEEVTEEPVEGEAEETAEEPVEVEEEVAEESAEKETEEVAEESVEEEAEEAAEEPAKEATEEAVEEPVAEETEEVAEESVEEEAEEVAEESAEKEAEEAAEESAKEEKEEAVEEPVAEEKEETVEEPVEEEAEETVDQHMVEKIKEVMKQEMNSSLEEAQQVQEAISLKEVTEVPLEKPKVKFKTKEAAMPTVSLDYELDEYLAEREREVHVAKYEESGIKIRKNVKVNRASLVKSNQEEVAAVVEEQVVEAATTILRPEDAPASFGMVSEPVKTTKPPKANPYLIRVNTEERIMITKQNFKVGKANMGVDYTVKGNGAVSRVHAIISSKEDVYYIKDNKSTNHTVVNGRTLEEGEIEQLTNNCKIMLGNEEFVFKLG